MKKCLCTLCALIVIIGMIGSFPVFAAGSMTASANTSSVTVGSTVTVTVKYDGGGTPIGSVDTQISYNASAFDYVSCSGATAYGDAGIIRVSWYATDINAPTSTTFSLVFKAKAVGNGNFAITTTGFIDDNDTSLGSPSKTLSVSATNPTLSGNADLKSLKPSAGTLTPAFKAATTAYSITVPYTVTSLSLSAVAAHSGAKVNVAGSNSLQVGKNTQVITVTAPNGTTKKYTVTITRSANQTTDGNQNTTTTTASPEEKPLEVEVDGALLTVADTQPDVPLPHGYAWEPLEFNGTTVSAAVNKKSGLTLLYLRGATAENSAFYIYREGEFTPFRSISTDGALYVLDAALFTDYDIPGGTVSGSVTIGEQKVDAYLFEDEELADVALIFAIGPNGYTGLYVYDTTDGSMQRYREFASAPADTDPQQEPVHPILQIVLDNRTLLLVAAACVGALGLLTIAIVLIVRAAKRPHNCRH